MQSAEFNERPDLTDILTGKGHKDENFPVASVLLPKKLRPYVLKYYKFARTADDIADTYKLKAEDKVAMLEKMRAIVDGEVENDREFIVAEEVRESLSEKKISKYHATDLLVAFKRDAEGLEYRSWSDLIDYCNYSAAPVGRFLLDLHGESRTTFKASDAICAALQINNHIQDAQEDYEKLGRSYVPLNYLKDESLTYEDLRKHHSSEAMRRVFDRMLDGVDELLEEGQDLPLQIKNKGFRIEVAIIIALAKKLAYKLRTQDPLANHVSLRGKDWKGAVVAGILKGLFPKFFKRKK